jgi:uncharacterized protein (TIGR02444 family)
MHAAVPSAWDFAVTVYGRPGVRAACLALQDRCGADVVAMLALLNRAALGLGVLPAERVREALASAAPWRAQAVLPLRRIRRALKHFRFGDGAPDPQVESVRAAVAEAELAAERVELERLTAALGTREAPSAPPIAGCAAGPAADGAALLALYLRVAGLAVDGQGRADLATLLGACFPADAADATGLVDAALSM